MTSRNRHPLETGLAQDLRRLHEEPPDARLREDAARRHRPFPRIGLVRRGERGQARLTLGRSFRL